MRDLQEAEKVTLARLREYFSQPQAMFLYLGVPLLVKAFETAAKSTNGTGVFGKVLSIQRLHTAGGQAPSAAWGHVEIRPTATRYVDGSWQGAQPVN